MLGFESKEVKRLDIPQYNWWNESLHGIARAGKATVFPQAIGMAASFNDNLLNEVANAISTEARAKNNMAVAKDRRLQYMGLNFGHQILIFSEIRVGEEDRKPMEKILSLPEKWEQLTSKDYKELIQNT